MRKTLIAATVAGLFSLPSVVMAQAAAPAAAPASPHTITGNLGIFSSYRFRGIDQTFGKPALQGGIDYSHSSGIYLGNWNSNVNEGAGFPDSNLEMDFYGGYKFSVGDFGFDVGAIYYYYPGSDAGLDSTGLATKLGTPANNRTGRFHNGSVSNTEVYVGATWKFLSAKYFHSVDDYFSTPNTDGSGYFDLSATYDLGNGWGVNGHVGYLDFDNMRKADYTDWKIGVTKDISGWVVGLSYIDTDANGSCSKGEFYCFTDGSDSTKNAGRGIAVLSVSKSF